MGFGRGCCWLIGCQTGDFTTSARWTCLKIEHGTQFINKLAHLVSWIVTIERRLIKANAQVLDVAAVSLAPAHQAPIGVGQVEAHFCLVDADRLPHHRRMGACQE